MQPLEIELQPRTRREVLGGLLTHVRRGARGQSKLNDDVWTLVTSRQFEADLAAATILDRRFQPFEDRELFPAGSNLGPFEAYRSAEVSERVNVLPRPSFVEPQWGWVIAEPYQLVRRGHKDMHNLPAPSVRNFVGARRHARNMSTVASLVNLRDRAERTYGHVMGDLVGGRLRLAAECGLEDVPVLVSKKLYEQPYFRDLLLRAGFSDRNFIVQDGEYVRTETAFVFDTSLYSRASIDYIQRILAVPDADPDSERRIFIVRKSDEKVGRGVTNMDEVADVCQRFGVEMVATDDMRLDEQIELFSQTRVVFGVHGSALFNIAFRKQAKLTVVEIVPPGADTVRPRPLWFFHATALGHDYELMRLAALSDGVIGKAAFRRDFAIDPAHLTETLASVVDRI